MNDKNKPTSSADTLIPLLLLIAGLTFLFIVFCYTEYNRNVNETWRTMHFYETWDEVPSLRTTYYYCAYHTPGRDPQQLDMQAKTYGWTQVRCPVCLLTAKAAQRSQSQKP